jgi:hypothetical protein
VEAQLRSLADLAFMLGQYESAAASYRLAAQDYLAAPHSKWYAGAEVRRRWRARARARVCVCACVCVCPALLPRCL